MSTYTIPTSQSFQDVDITPATLKDGSLAQRFNTKRYPRLGTDQGAAAGGATPNAAVTASNDAPAAGAAVTLTATVTGVALGGRSPQGTVTFKDGATVLGTATLGAGVASLVRSGGFTVGAHSITAVYPGDGLYDAATSPAHVVTAH